MKLRLAIPAIVVAVTLTIAPSAQAVVIVEYEFTVTEVEDTSGVFPRVSVDDTGMGEFRYDPILVPTQQSNIIAILIGLLPATQSIDGIVTGSEDAFTLTLTRATEDVMEIRFEGIQGFDFPNESITYRFTAFAGNMIDENFSLPDPSIFAHRGTLTSAEVEVVLGDSRLMGDLDITAVVPEPSGIVIATLCAVTLCILRAVTSPTQARNCSANLNSELIT